jgi:hypothetical protein
MHDTAHPDDAPPPAEPDRPAESDTAAKPGGFGAFADLYRARWAANHPNMRRRAETGAESPAASADDQPAVRPFAEDGTRLIRPGEHK